MTYGIYFDSATPAEALRQALHTVYGVPPELVYVGPYEALPDHPGPDPVVLITPVDGPFGHEVSGGARLQELTRAPELELARRTTGSSLRRTAATAGSRPIRTATGSRSCTPWNPSPARRNCRWCPRRIGPAPSDQHPDAVVAIGGEDFHRVTVRGLVFAGAI